MGFVGHQTCLDDGYLAENIDFQRSTCSYIVLYLVFLISRSRITIKIAFIDITEPNLPLD
jgi:hypothetical protein